MNKMNFNNIIIYELENGKISIDVKIEGDTLWLSLNEIARLFDRNKSVISRHLNNIYKEGELNQDATVAYFATVQKEGKRKVERQIEYYNLDAIISVGYRVNSKRGTQFRIWANNILKEYLLKGYTINQNLINSEKVQEIIQYIDLLTNTLTKQSLVNETGAQVLELIKNYSVTWHLLIKYDEKKLVDPEFKQNQKTVRLTYKESKEAITILRNNLAEQGENISLFGLEREKALEGILGNIYQTFDRIMCYKTNQEKAAHLLYFVIKDHPFVDGNKRIGSFLFLLYLKKAGHLNYKLNEITMTAIALLVAESDSNQKEIMIKLILNILNY